MNYKRVGAWGMFLFLVVAAVLFFRIYRIDGTSMNYGLTQGDIVISSRYFQTVERGELFVIRHPDDPYGRLYIKRCTAVPKDRYFERKRLFYLQLEGNSEKTGMFAQKYGLVQTDTPFGVFLKEPYARYYGVVHDWRLSVPAELTTLPLMEVKKGHYLMLGDFRDNSADSRFFGAVPREWIHSKVLFILKRPKSWESLLSIKEADE